MAYNPIVAGSVASSAYMNAALQAAIIRVDDLTALEATLTHSNPPATGGWLFQEDTEVIKKRAGSSFTDVLDLRRTRGLAAPDLDFVTSAGTDLGTIRGSSPLTGQTQYDFLNPAGVSQGRILAGQNVFSIRSASNASALTLSNIAPSFTSTGTINIGGRNINLQTATLDISQAAPNLTLTPTLELGGTAVAANKYLGTDSAGRLAALDAPTGGGGGVAGDPAESFFTPSLPAAVRSAVGETQVNIAAGTIDADHPFSVTGNGIVVAAGTNPFFATVDYVLEINPTSWQTDANQGANRLFIDLYFKKDGVIIQDTRISHYIRGDERFAPSEHTINGVFGEILSPGTYTLWIERTTAAGSGNAITGYEIVGTNSDIHIVTPGATGSGTGASTFIGLTDTPSAFGTAGQIPIVNATATGLAFGNIPPPTLAANSVTAAQAQLDTMEHRQEWHHRLDIPTHDTVGIQDFTIFSGVPTSGGLVGFASTQAGTINGNTHSASFRVNDNLYSVTQVAQITTAGTNLNNIILRIGPDPETNGDVNADWYFQIGGVFLSFADATKTSVPGNRVTYTWTGSPRLFIGGQTTICRMRQPLDDIHSGIPSNFSALQGTVAPEQFRDSSIRLYAGYRRDVDRPGRVANNGRVCGFDEQRRATLVLCSQPGSSTSPRHNIVE